VAPTGSPSVELLALAGQPNFGAQWSAFCAWPCWDGRDRAQDVVARIARALSASSGGDAGCHQHGNDTLIPTVEALLSKEITAHRALGRFCVLFGGDAVP
jgi:hypothetical protein